MHDLTGAARPGVPLTFENHNLFPIWFPNGKRILFFTRGRTKSLNAVAADSSSLEPETLATDAGPLMPMDWVPWTDLVVVGEFQGANKHGSRSVPDGRWMWRDRGPRPPRGKRRPGVARRQVGGVCLPFGRDGRRCGCGRSWAMTFCDPISKDGENDPVWSADGGELFYRNGSKIMAVRVAAALAQTTVESIQDTVRRWFQGCAARIRCGG